MSTAKDTARQLTERIKRAESTNVKIEALTEMFNGVRSMVVSAAEEKELAGQLAQLDRELLTLHNELHKAEDTKRGEFQKEIDDIQETKRQAEMARRGLDKNRMILRALEKQLYSLLNEVKRALN